MTRDHQVPQIHSYQGVEPFEAESHHCSRCQQPILDEFITSVMNRWWHEKCLRCDDCEKQLSESCFARDGHTYCREDFYRRFAPRCFGCDEVFHPSDLVRKARDRFYHVMCFVCADCGRQLHTGDQLFFVGPNSFVCHQDYVDHHSLDYSPDEENDDCEQLTVSTTTTTVSGNSKDNNNKPSRAVMSLLSSQERPLIMMPQTTSLVVSEPNKNVSQMSSEVVNQTESKEPLNDDDDGSEMFECQPKPEDPGNKRRGPRTTIKARQLEVLKMAFAQMPKPSRHIRERLAEETGLPMRVIQVWFQNKRSKERRLKQICSRTKFVMASQTLGGRFSLNDDPSVCMVQDARPDLFYPAQNSAAAQDFFGVGHRLPILSAFPSFPPYSEEVKCLSLENHHHQSSVTVPSMMPISAMSQFVKSLPELQPIESPPPIYISSPQDAITSEMDTKMRALQQQSQGTQL